MNAIEVTNVSKSYRLYGSRADRIRELISPSRRKFHHEFQALRDVSFNVEKGQTVGIIGQNGSGKSTLLKIICGVLQPSGGKVHAHGRISSLLELGTGFNPEFTGRDNVYMNGALLGFSREEMDQRFSEIEEFAEIGTFMDQPVKTYSSGMQVRLGFSAAVHIDPEILVVDEALAVGDIPFQSKCIAKMEAFLEQGRTVLLVTHDVNFLKNMCDVVYLLKDGQIYDSGSPEDVTEKYMMLMKQRHTKQAVGELQVEEKIETTLRGGKISFGSARGQILEVQILDAEFNETNVVTAGQAVVIRIRAHIDSDVRNPSIGFVLRDRRGYDIYGTNTGCRGLPLNVDEKQRATVFFSLSPALASGSYTLVAGLSDYTSETSFDLLDKQVGVGAFSVIPNKHIFFGVIDLQANAFLNQMDFRE